MPHSPSLPTPPWRIAVDVGGTFTDMVLVDAGGRFHVFKTPSVPADPSRGVLDVLEHAAHAFGADVERLLSDCTLFLHGSTVATNTVLEGSGARVGMLVTRGFRDFLEARRGFRADPFDHRPALPPGAGAALPAPAGGRTGGCAGHRGRTTRRTRSRHCHRNVPERGSGIDRGLSPAPASRTATTSGGAPRCCANEAASSGCRSPTKVVPVIGEYERGSTTVVNAYIGPKVVRYLQALDERLRALGLGPDLVVLQSNGRAISIRQVAHCPVNLVLSGPAGGVGALDYFAAATGFDDLITMEIGGTSCDVMLRAGGRVAVTDRLEVGGYDLVSVSVDIHTVGAGGGTIAGADAAGLLFAGPRGAGAVPGPAAYGRGGEEPTVTDAQLVLGRLAPGPYAGGAVSLDLERAETALRTRVGEPLGLELHEAAIGVIRLVEQNLLQAVERISIERGRDPARFVLVACGGAGPMHGAAVGRRLGARGVLVPRLAGVFCALGMLNADVGQDFRPGVHRTARRGHRERGARRVRRPLEGDARTWLRQGGFETDAMRFEHEADLRYAGQQWDVRVADAPAEVAELRAAFEREHDRLFGHVQPDSTVELTKLRVVGIGTLPALEPVRAEPCGTVPEPASTREVYAFGPRGEPLGFMPTPVYRGADLLPGHRLDGPLLVEEQTTTVVVGPGDRLEVLASGDLFLRFDDP